jgi:drug/metabolite transporter (DMT)-like permease
VALLLALSAAALSGSGDFFGGFASRRGRVMGVVLANHVSGVVTVLILGRLFGGTVDGQTVLWGSLAGFCGAGAVMALYTGFSRSSMAVVSPVAAVGAAVWPVLFDVGRGRMPGLVVVAGLIVGLIAIWTLSSTGRFGDADDVRSGVLYGLLAGLGFGGLLIFLSLGSGSSGIWALLPARIAGSLVLTVLVLMTTREFLPDRGSVVPSIAAGVLVTLGNGFFVLATTKGSLAVVSVLAAMFPAATVILAWVVLRERLTRQRQLGLALALVAVGLVAGG